MVRWKWDILTGQGYLVNTTAEKHLLRKYYLFIHLAYYLLCTNATFSEPNKYVYSCIVHQCDSPQPGKYLYNWACSQVSGNRVVVFIPSRVLGEETWSSERHDLETSGSSWNLVAFLGTQALTFPYQLGRRSEKPSLNICLSTEPQWALWNIFPAPSLPLWLLLPLGEAQAQAACPPSLAQQCSGLRPFPFLLASRKCRASQRVELTGA